MGEDSSIKIHFPVEVKELSASLPELPAKSMSNSTSDSKLTTASIQTLSDKLSALPASSSTPTGNRLRSPFVTPSSILPNRAHRRSFDGSLPLSSLSTPDAAPSPTKNARGSTSQSLTTHLAAGGVTPDHGSVERGTTPKQRVSFDSERGSMPSVQNVRQAFSRIANAGITSPAQRSSAYKDSRKEAGLDSSYPDSYSPSRSPSRPASPLRLFQQWSAGRQHHHRHRHHVDEPFVPVDPFKSKVQFHFPCFPTLADPLVPNIHANSANAHTHTNNNNESSPSTIPVCEACVPKESIQSSWSNARFFFSDTLPRQVYLNLLLRLPAMYFTRVAKIFEDAEVSRPDIQRMIESRGGGWGLTFAAAPTPAPASEPGAFGTVDSNYPTGRAGANTNASTEHPQGTLSPTMAAVIGMSAQVGASPATGASASHLPLPFPDEWTPPLVSPALIRFKLSWEVFVDSLLREWKTLNVVSALLLSAILTMFQIPSAAEDPVTRTAALLSLICALMSLSYGCMYIVRFGTMRSMFRAAKWAEEARKTDTLIWWNVWVLLAMPAVWLAWSMVLFIISILSFVWRAGSALDPEDRPPLSARAILGPRIAITFTFGLGMIYFALIVKTLRSYGTHTGGPYWTQRANGNGNGAVQEQQTPRMMLRARDIDAAMERRGRPRHRREEPSPLRVEKGVEVDVCKEERTSKDRGSSVGGGLRSILGLGIPGAVPTRDRDQEPNRMDLDLEKGGT